MDPNSDHPRMGVRKNKNGRQVYEIPWDHVEGYFHKIQKKKGDYGWELNVCLKPEKRLGETDTLEILSFPLYGKLGEMFLNQFGNLGSAEIKVQVRMWGRQDPEKKTWRVAVYLNTEPLEDGGKWDGVGFKWEADDNYRMEGLPDLREVEVQGQTHWDRTARVNAMLQVLMPEINALNGDEPFIFEKREGGHTPPPRDEEFVSGGPVGNPPQGDVDSILDEDEGEMPWEKGDSDHDDDLI